MDRNSLTASQTLGWALLSALLGLIAFSAGFRLVIAFQRFSDGTAGPSSLLAWGAIVAVLASSAILSVRRAVGLKRSVPPRAPTAASAPGTHPRERTAIRITGLKNPDAVEHWFDTTLADIAHVTSTGVDTADIVVGDSIDVGDQAGREFVTAQMEMALSSCGEAQATIEFLSGSGQNAVGRDAG